MVLKLGHFREYIRNTQKVLKWMEKISGTNHVINDEVLHRVEEERNILLTIKRRKANWIGHSLHRNCIVNMLWKER